MAPHGTLLCVALLLRLATPAAGRRLLASAGQGGLTAGAEDAAPAPPRQEAADADGLLTAALARARGTTNASCYTDVACAGDSWHDAADAVVLLLMASPAGARFCTGTLLNTAHLAAAGQAATYVLSASHCRGFDTGDDAALYSAVFDERQGACAWPGAAASPAQPAPAPRVLTGLRVAWQDEASDVLLLRADGAIPAEYGAYYLGWDASGWAPDATAPATISHPRGDVKKLSLGGEGLRRAHYSPAGGDSASGGDATHYQVRWTQGGTDVGSSGAPLLDAGRRQALGVLTGGEAATCGNRDFFGSLHAAWLRGLWRVLSPAGPQAVAWMPGSRQQGCQQGLVVSPGALLLSDGASSGQAAQLWVRLAAQPAAGEQLTVAVAVQQAEPPQLPGAAADVAAPGENSAGGAGQGQAPAPHIAASPQRLQFSDGDWAQEQAVTVSVGAGDDRAEPPTAFNVTLHLSSGSDSSSGCLGAAGWSTVVRGRRVDGDTPAGSTPQQPILIQAGEQLDYAAEGVLLVPAVAAAAGPAPDSPEPAAPAQRYDAVRLGQALGSLAAAGRPQGLVQYYSLTTAGTVNVSISACSAEGPLQVALFAHGVASW
ncbi:hypothetical protein CHLNCDRAFT_51569 [Chlorella variabilis]|uniref:Peptidase S1 domain-containing protein n=1 Tax=Chlorella variabilis TaxID=554065 RepID=E1ZCD2_CHLVA|nr:hypothetical protein CHLNCDRAFT_51569 [Chlorella variabilis]EFN56797.1 hypothetical protein CHLNCDRAFT_51569 [Chlorella variabilis]|eukprot:XP_005848899.1 hypothetical protein CHLNCDRAFT_51569 [Chlorella variabilis]